MDGLRNWCYSKRLNLSDVCRLFWSTSFVLQRVTVEFHWTKAQLTTKPKISNDNGKQKSKEILLLQMNKLITTKSCPSAPSLFWHWMKLLWCRSYWTLIQSPSTNAIQQCALPHCWCKLRYSASGLLCDTLIMCVCSNFSQLACNRE